MEEIMYEFWGPCPKHVKISFIGMAITYAVGYCQPYKEVMMGWGIFALGVIAYFIVKGIMMNRTYMKLTLEKKFRVSELREGGNKHGRSRAPTVGVNTGGNGETPHRLRTRRGEKRPSQTGQERK